MWVVVSIITIVLFISVFGMNMQNTHAFVMNLGIWAPVISILLYGFLSLTPLPAEPLSIANGALFGPFVGIIVNFLGNNFAATVEYAVGRDILLSGQKKKNVFKKTKLPGILGKIPADSVWFLLLGRAIPGYGSKVVSFAGGVYQVSLIKYAWTTALMNLLGSILLALSGHALFGLK